MHFVIGDLPGVDQYLSVKNNEIISGLKLGLGEVFSKFETLKVEFEAFICPGNFGFLGDLGFSEAVAQQFEHVNRSLEVLEGFLRNNGLTLRPAGVSKPNYH